MVRKILVAIVSFAVAGSAFAGGFGLWIITNTQKHENPKPADTRVLPATHQYQEVPTLTVLLEQKTGEVGQYNLCQQSQCRLQLRPGTIPSASAFDGLAWYSYTDEGALVRDAAGEEVRTVVAPNELVAPRDVAVSANSRNAAYWLDNTTKDSNGLTELWVYDGIELGTYVVAEKLVKSDILSPLRWNSAGSTLSFFADSGEGAQEKPELVVVTTRPVGVKARFLQVDMPALRQATESGVMDISPSGEALAFAERRSGNKSVLHVVREGSKVQSNPVPGDVSFVQWIGEGLLVYAIQRDNEIQFMRWENATHTRINTEPGILVSAAVEDSGKYISYVIQEQGADVSLRTMSAHNGLSRQQTALNTRGDWQIIRATAQEKDISVTSELTDGQLISFVERHINVIAGMEVTILRVIMADKANTVFVEFEDSDAEARRYLLTVRDAIHPEWIARAQYEPAGGEWRKIQGGTSTDPVPLRLYEWEDSAAQWILKQELQPGAGQKSSTTL